MMHRAKNNRALVLIIVGAILTKPICQMSEL